MFFVCVAGPTGVGKSDWAVQLSRYMPIEIINGDSAQFYKPLSIGTAKPDWETEPVPHHLFDSIDRPVDFSVLQYRDVLIRTAQDILARGNIPVVVGGSSFYWYSLFFPPRRVQKKDDAHQEFCIEESIPTEQLWQQLFSIDPERAQQLAQGDRYRIKRALYIWHTTGKKPSECKPVFDSIGTCLFVFITRDRACLYDRINRRTPLMFEQGWIDEVCGLSDEWKKFVCRKGFIGYPEIVEHCQQSLDVQSKTYQQLVEKVQQQTRRYARKQEAFFRRFENHIHLLPEKDRACTAIESINLSHQNFEQTLADCASQVKRYVESMSE